MVNHSLAAKLATDLLLLRSLGRLFSYRKFIISSCHCQVLERFAPRQFFNNNLTFCNLIEHDRSFFIVHLS